MTGRDFAKVRARQKVRRVIAELERECLLRGMQPPVWRYVDLESLGVVATPVAT